jgi:hypothetical protein
MKKRFHPTRHFTPTYLLFLSIALFIQQFLPGYLRYSTIEAISWKMNDGWCDPSRDGIGTHCFGDFYYPLTFVAMENPWKGVLNPYPPISTFLYRPFDLLADFTAPRFSLSLWLLCLLACLLFPAAHLKFAAKEIGMQSFVTIILITLTCAPALVSLDRGNNLLLVIPPLYLFFRGCLLKNEKKTLLFGLICVCLKPQFVVLIFVIYSLFGLNKAIRWLLASAFVNLSSFLLYFQSFPENIFYWIHKALGFQEYGARGILMPVNLSLKSDIEIVVNAFDLNISQSIVQSFVYLVLIIFTIILIRNLGKRSVIHNFSIVLLYPLLFTGTVFHYYLAILYIPFVFLFLHFIEPRHTGSLRAFSEVEAELPSLTKPLQSSMFLVLVVFSLIPWGIPWSAVFSGLSGRGWDIIGVNWVFSQYLLLFFAIVIVTQRTRGRFLGNHENLRD